MNTSPVKTNWVVITGAPSSGKTSVILELAKRGFDTQGEVARELIEARLQKGETLERIKGDDVGLQNDILNVKLSRHRALDPTHLVFLDRGICDSVTYFRLAGGPPEAAAAAAKLYTYRAVFIFDRLPLIKDGIRAEDDALARRIDEGIEADYRALGYDTIRVPVIPVPQRADLLLRALGLPAQAA